MSNTATATYPAWKFYPSRSPAPSWVPDLVDAFAGESSQIASTANHGVSSDAALGVLRPVLTELGFHIEAGKSKADKITRPVLFGEAGRSVVSGVNDHRNSPELIIEIPHPR
ncbi:MAG: hypothetical protein M3433_06620 [Actinomycetota bacterium]|nr:hypothetical protein [Actinomycetota bacterium]